MFTKDFWNAKATENGHTGGEDSFAYSFDQEAKRFAVQKILSRLVPESKRDRALDYGCGSGDFTSVLKDKFSLVVGYDFAEKVLEIAEKQQSNGTKFTADKRVLWDNSLYDMILSVSVLQDFNYQELNDVVRELSLLLVSNGYLVAVEFFANEEWNAIHNEERTTVSEWNEVLEANGLTVVSRHTFYNPLAAPISSWKEYESNLWLKTLRLTGNSAIARKAFSEKAKEIIQKYQDVLGVEDNSCYIYVIQKAPHAD